MGRDLFKARSNPFKVKTAESYRKPEDITLVFANPPGYEAYNSPDNLIILGSRGCGKTILLKQLSMPVQSLESDVAKLNFCGVYIQRLLQVNNLLQIYRRAPGSVSKFEHYFTLKVMYEVANQFSQASVPTETKVKISDIIMTNLELRNLRQDLHSLAHDLEETIEKLERHLSSDPASKVVDPTGLKIQNLSTLLVFLRSLSREIYPACPKVGLLIDDFQDYEELGIFLLNNLVSHKFLDFLCVKLGARKFDLQITDLSVEYLRDFEIECLDGNPNDREWLNFIRYVANKKLKAEWQLSEDDLQRINIDTLFPAMKPENIQWDDRRSPGENLAKIKDQTLRRKCFSGFETMVKVLMVNPFEFFEVCDKAYEIEERDRVSVTIPPGISQDAQISALLGKTRNYIDVELVSRKGYSGFFFGMRSLIVNLARYLEQNQNPPLFEGARIALPEGISIEYRKLLKSAIIHRDLFVPNEQLIPTLLNPFPIIGEIEINRQICPRYGISWEYIGNHQINEETIKNSFEKRYGEPTGRKKTTLVETQYLFDMESQNPWVFEARPHGFRENKIQRTVNSLRREELKTVGRTLPPEGIAYMDEEIARQQFAPRFTDYLGEGIRNSLYVVADIMGEFKTGVAYEIGAGFAYKKPVFLFWDSVWLKREFEEKDKKLWHPFMIKHDLKEWTSEAKRKPSFKQWYKTYIDDIGKKESGRVKCPIKMFGQPRCEFENFVSKGINKSYILFQSQNDEAESFVINFLSERDCYPIQSSDLPKEADDICSRCISIHASRFQIIDGSAPEKGKKGNSACALELGFAYALHRENTLMLYDAEIHPEPVVMFAGSSHGWHRSTMEKDIREKLREFMDKFPDFGGIKK